VADYRAKNRTSKALNPERIRLAARFSEPAPKAVSYNRFARGPVQTKDDVTPAIAGFIGSMLKDTAESVGQVSNEYINQTPIGMLAKPVLGTDLLSRAVGSVNAGAGESMRGEVTPMDLVNVASLLPIPVGGVVRGGLLAGRAGAKFLPSGLKGIKALDASTEGIKDRATAMSAGPIASVIERGIGSAFVEATPDAILSSPAVIDISKSDLPLEQKIALIGGIVGLVAAPGTAASVFERGKLKVSQGNIAKGQGTLTDEVRVATYNTPYSASDRALSSETSMPAVAIAGSTFGGRQAYQTKWDISLYETDPEFKRIYDDLLSGGKWEDAQNAFKKWKIQRTQQGLDNPNTVPQTFEELEKYVKTGTLSNSYRGSRKSPNLPNKPQRFSEALEGDATMIVYDSREKKLYDMLVAKGELIPGGQTTGARGKIPRNTQLERKELNEWFIKTFGITDPQRLQAVRERMYQALENIV